MISEHTVKAWAGSSFFCIHQSRLTQDDGFVELTTNDGGTIRISPAAYSALVECVREIERNRV